MDAALERYGERLPVSVDDVPVARPHDHTMAEDLDMYTDQRVPAPLIRDAVINRTRIEVHGIYPSHFRAVADRYGWQVVESLGASELAGKALNGRRPQSFLVRDPYGRDILCFAVPPGADYVLHFASMVLHVVGRHTAFGAKLLRIWRYPDAERSIARWTGLDAGLLGGADTVVFGKVELVARVLADAGYVCDSKADTPYYVAVTVTSDHADRRITLLGVRFSYWGSISARLVARCCELGVREVLYVGKLGTLRSPADIYRKLYVPSRYAVLGRLHVRRMIDGPPNPFLERFPALDSGLHVSVPTVIEEDHAQRGLAELLGAQTMDNEMAQMACAVADWNAAHCGQVGFSGLHYATDYLRRPDEATLAVPYSLARGRSGDARDRRFDAERLIADCLRGYFEANVVMV